MSKLKEFKSRKWNSTHIQSYCVQGSKTRETVLRDEIAYSILKEQGFSVQEDPASIYDPQKLYEGLERFAPSNHVKTVWNKDLQKAFNATFKLFAKPKKSGYLYVDMQPNTVVKALKMEKSSGLPFLRSKDDDFWYGMNRSKQILQDVKRPTPAIAYTRTSHGSKTRLVWGYPIDMTILESTFARPLIDMFLNKRTPMAFGMSKFTLGGIISSIDRSPGVTRSIDYSKFDSTISAEFIKRAFAILETWFDDDDLEEYGWNKIVDYFIHTPIVMPNGKVYFGKEHGVPSGSYFTQLIDSIVNVMLNFYLADKHNYPLDWEDFMVLGDDVIVSIPERVSLYDLSNSLAKLGIIMNPDKCREDSHFLGANWVKGIPYRPLPEIMTRMVYTEKFRRYEGKTWEEKRREAYGMMLNYCSQYANAYEALPEVTPYRQDLVEYLPVSYKKDIDITKGYTGYGRYKAEYLDVNKKPTHLLSSRLMS